MLHFIIGHQSNEINRINIITKIFCDEYVFIKNLSVSLHSRVASQPELFIFIVRTGNSVSLCVKYTYCINRKWADWEIIHNWTEKQKDLNELVNKAVLLITLLLMWLLVHGLSPKRVDIGPLRYPKVILSDILRLFTNTWADVYVMEWFETITID